MLGFRNTRYKKSLLSSVIAALVLLLCGCIKKGDTAVQEGSRLFQAGNYEQARAAFEVALTEDCSYHKETIYIMLANTYSQQGDYDSAIEWRRKALEIKDDANNYINLGLLYRIKQDEAEAERMYQKALEMAPYDPATNASLGSLYLSQGKEEMAAELFTKSLEADDSSGLVHADLAVCLARMGRFSEADEQLELAKKRRVDNYLQFAAEIDSLKANAAGR